MSNITQLRVNGTLYDIKDNSITQMGASGSDHKSGLVPDPGSTGGTTKFLREDGTWAEPTSQSSISNGPTYNPITRSIDFPSGANVSYDETNRTIIIS